MTDVGYASIKDKLLDKLHSAWLYVYEPLINFLFYLPGGGEDAFRTQSVEFANLKEGEQILDICCGDGELVRYVAQRVFPGGHIIGIDISESALKKASQKAHDLTVDFLISGAGSLPFRASHFDKCFISLGLHHMSESDRNHTLKEACRVLKEGGSLIVVEYNLPEKALVKLIARAFARFDKSDEAYKMVMNLSLLKEIEMAGLKISRKQSVCGGIVQLVEAVNTGVGTD